MEFYPPNKVDPHFFQLQSKSSALHLCFLLLPLCVFMCHDSCVTSVCVHVWRQCVFTCHVWRQCVFMCDVSVCFCPVDRPQSVSARPRGRTFHLAAAASTTYWTLPSSIFHHLVHFVCIDFNPRSVLDPSAASSPPFPFFFFLIASSSSSHCVRCPSGPPLCLML